MKNKTKFSCGLPYNTGYEGVSFISYEEITYGTKKFYLETEGILICDRCGYESKDINEKWFRVRIMDNYLPDYRIYCEKCVSKVF